MGFVIGRQVQPVDKKVRSNVEYITVATETKVAEETGESVEKTAEEPSETKKPARRQGRRKKGGAE